MPKLLLATTNQGKLREFRHIFQGLPFELVSPAEEGIDIVVNENQPSYEENAILKAKAYAQASHLVTLADDSGLEVDALDGEPGIHSARAAGENASDRDRVVRLLARLQAIPREKRSARFVCVIAIATPGEKVETCQDECHGMIGFEPRGDKGFGYDPVFYFTELDKTMAELPMEMKNQVSHRGKAARKARQVLEKLVEAAKP